MSSRRRVRGAIIVRVSLLAALCVRGCTTAQGLTEIGICFAAVLGGCNNSNGSLG